MTTAGRFDQRIAFASRGPRDPSEPDDGNTQGAFVERFTLNAARKYLRGTESVVAARLTGRQPVIFILRASSLSKQVNTDWRAQDARTGTIYAIKGVTLTEDRAFVEVLAESGVAP